MRFMWLLIISCASISTYAQVRGMVTGNDGDPLSYVNVYILGTSNGTTTNLEGEYSLDLEVGKHTIVYQYVGYGMSQFDVDFKGDAIDLDVVLNEQEYLLEDIVILADGEDPAYAIIRKAQAKRKEHLAQFNNYQCDAYVKGFTKLTSSPGKVLGMDIGDFDGALDEEGAGVVYLSESISKLYYQDGESKEVIYSSKVSGDDLGYSYNSAQEMDFNFYENRLELQRELISPIARNALQHYKYKLEGASLDQEGQLVNKIEVTPKNKYDNCFEGYLYINEDSWSINSLDLYATKNATKIPFADTIRIVQSFVPQSDNVWVPLSNVISANIAALGFVAVGKFACIYSDYIIGPVDGEEFSNVIYEVKAEANERDEAYWDEIRPIPLTNEESLDYKVKDSIRIVRNSPAYLDSVDRAENKFKLINLLSGYTRQNSLAMSSWKIKSPIYGINLNTIQGWNNSIAVDYNKSYDKDRTRRLSSSFSLNGGLSEEKIRPYFDIDYLANRVNNLFFKFEVGQVVTQFSRTDPISAKLNSILTFFFDENFLKAYDKSYARISVRRDIANGISGSVSLDGERRSPLVNNYLTSQKRIDREFSSNNPELPFNDSPAFEEHEALIFRANLMFNFKQKIWKYPNRVFKENSKWPTLNLHYKTAAPVLGADANYHLLYSRITKIWELGIYGETSMYALGGSFLGDNKPEYFIDHFIFSGNQTTIGFPRSYRSNFLKLAPYALSTNQSFFSFHAQHHFDGYILSKIPLLKRLGFSLVGGYKLLTSTDNPLYQELHIGLDNIGIKAFRLFRLDLVWNNVDCVDGLCQELWKPSLIYGVKIRL